MNDAAESQDRSGRDFEGWAGWLAADGSLTPGLREAYRQTVSEFLEFGRRRGAASR